MTERHFRLLLGLLLLGFLYFDIRPGVEVLIGYLLFEAATNWRLPMVLNRIAGGAPYRADGGPVEVHAPVRFSFSAERALRVTIVIILSFSVWIFPQQLWWMAWFVGFALVGAGISGICPMLSSLRILGFR